MNPTFRKNSSNFAHNAHHELSRSSLIIFATINDMTNHHLHLHPEPFELIRSGNKTVESRLFDDKRRAYRIGDELIFTNRASGETISTTVIKLHRASSFSELFLNEEASRKFGSDSLDKLLENIEIYYSKDDQQKYGVLGIEFTSPNIRDL